MDFQAVIKAILNKGDVESQLADLVKDTGMVHINPTVGTSGSTNTTLITKLKDRQMLRQNHMYNIVNLNSKTDENNDFLGRFYS